MLFIHGENKGFRLFFDKVLDRFFSFIYNCIIQYIRRRSKHHGSI